MEKIIICIFGLLILGAPLVTLIILVRHFINRKNIRNAKRKIIMLVGLLIAELLVIGVGMVTAIQPLYGVTLDIGKSFETKDHRTITL